jgi:outer membrane protein
MMSFLKKLFGLSLFALFISLSSFAQTKGKLGHIDSNKLLELMPEKTTAQTQLQEVAKQLQDQLVAMQSEYDTKVQEYQKNQAIYTELIKQTKVKEIGDLEQRIALYQQSAQDELEKKQTELLQPIIEKAKKAIQDVAKEQGYSYVFDSSIGVLLYFPDTDDILPLVKAKLSL